MIKLSIKNCNPKTGNGDYIVSASVTTDNVETQSALQFIFADELIDEDGYDMFPDGTLMVCDKRFAEVCLLVLFSYIYTGDDFCISVDDLEFFDVDNSVKEDLLRIAEFYYTIGGYKDA